MKKNLIAIVSAAALLGTGANARAGTLFQTAAGLLRNVTVSVSADSCGHTGVSVTTAPAPVVVHAPPPPPPPVVYAPPPPPRPVVVHAPPPRPPHHPVAHTPKPPVRHHPGPKHRRG